MRARPRMIVELNNLREINHEHEMGKLKIAESEERATSSRQCARQSP